MTSPVRGSQGREPVEAAFSSSTTGVDPLAGTSWLPDELRKQAMAASARRRRATISGLPPRPSSTWSESRPGDESLAPPSVRVSISRASSAINLALIEELLQESTAGASTYGVEESRDSFFDAFFLKPPKIDYCELMKDIESVLPEHMQPKNFFSIKRYVRGQWEGLRASATDAFKTRSGILTMKSFLAFYIAYILCLIPAVTDWMGRYAYVMAVSAIVNHPGRTIGAQIDGAVLTTVGTAAGLAWGSIGLALSALSGWLYNLTLAVFLGTFMAFVAYLRSYFIRLYQLVVCAGMAISYTCLAEVDGDVVKWNKIWQYALPWVLGQAIALLVCLCIFPDAGTLPVAEVFHRTFSAMDEGLVVPRPRDYGMRQRLSQAFFDLTTVYRDTKLDITIIRCSMDNLEELRNRMQSVIRGILNMRLDSDLLNDMLCGRPMTGRSRTSLLSDRSLGTMGRSGLSSRRVSIMSDDGVIQMGTNTLREPTQALIDGMRDGLRACDAAFMDITRYRSFLGPPDDVPSDLGHAQQVLCAAMSAFDVVEANLADFQGIRDYNPDIVRMLSLAQSVRMAADPIVNLITNLRHVLGQSSHIHFHPPAYKFWKSLTLTNSQVRHDRGAVTPSAYHQTFAKTMRLVENIQAREYLPANAQDDEQPSPKPAFDNKNGFRGMQTPQTTRHKVWRFLHHLQGFEGRYAARVVAVTGCLAIPAYLSEVQWWNEVDAWWAVCVAWILCHTMVGGSVLDLVNRVVCVMLATLWSAAIWQAGRINPYYMIPIAPAFMLPMMYRYTRTVHARSGLAGCLTFAVVSLGLVAESQHPRLAWYRGLAILAGVTAATIVNWIVWPFIARHELRTSLSYILFFLGIISRDIVTKYIYYQESQPATPADMRESEILDSHFRESLVRVRELLLLTRHELRLRGPFDPLPFAALINACEGYFNDLYVVRQCALFYAADFVRAGDGAKKILGFRRDSIASMLTNLYVLSGALYAGSKVPRYLPSAAIARKRLIDAIAELEDELIQPTTDEQTEHGKLALVYRYSFNESLTRCVAYLESMEKYTKLIVGEMGFDGEFKDSSDEESESEDDE